MTEETLYCNYCNGPIKESDDFCQHCGQKINHSMVVKSSQPQNPQSSNNMQQEFMFGTNNAVNSSENDMQITYVEQTQNSAKQPPNSAAVGALIMVIVGFLLFFVSNPITEWVTLGLAILAIITAIVALILQRNNPLAVLSIILSIAMILAFTSIKYDWPPFLN